jgi:hypothetical protein
MHDLTSTSGTGPISTADIGKDDIKFHRLSERSTSATWGFSRLFCLGKNRKEDCRQDRSDSDNNEQFNQGKYVQQVSETETPALYPTAY